MKKMIIFFVAIVLIVIVFSYTYYNYQKNLQIAELENASYKSYYQQEIFGTDLATLINKTINSNAKNDVEKNNKGIYVDNNENSISIDVTFSDDNKVHKIEELYNAGINNFVELYNQIKFKCVDIKYHDKTNKVKYMLFEQVTS